MLNENSIVKLTKNVLKRYEHNVKNGVLFLFDINTEAIWTGNSSSNDLVKLIDGHRTLKDIYLALQKLFDDYEYEELKESFDEIINDLLNKNFLEYVSS